VDPILYQESYHKAKEYLRERCDLLYQSCWYIVELVLRNSILIESRFYLYPLKDSKHIPVV